MKEKKQCVVHYDTWEMDCCGTPFNIGDVVEWDVSKFEAGDDCNEIIEIPQDDYCYNAHHFPEDVKVFKLTGRVAKIQLLYYKRESNGKYHVPVAGKLIPITETKDFEDDLGEFSPSMYVVHLESWNIKDN